MNFDYTIEGMEPADLGEAMHFMRGLTDNGIPLRITVAPGTTSPQEWFEFVSAHLDVRDCKAEPDGRLVFNINAAPRVLH
jgi:hypothetical protein